ncbi:MAG: hypothetical protein E6K49_12280 [Gammaproteobacteria bacterium]|nr:MAG: hypothetical protein E6K49_12280 [Gammaproteobacteria bacterium]
MTARIFEAYASLAVESSIDQLLATVPGGVELRERVVTGWSGASTKYDEATRAAYFLVCDGQTLACFTVSGVDPAEAGRIAAALQGNSDWTAANVVRAVEQALGGSAQRAQ